MRELPKLGNLSSLASLVGIEPRNMPKRAWNSRNQLMDVVSPGGDTKLTSPSVGVGTGRDSS